MIGYRALGDCWLELDAPEAVHREARQWMGRSGWQATAPRQPRELARIRIEGSSQRGELAAHSAELGALQGPPAPLLRDLEVRCITWALGHTAAPASLHAATLGLGAGRRDHGLLLVGAHLSGKTTLGLALASRGLAILGDDIALLLEPGTAASLPRPLRIRPASQWLIAEAGCPSWRTGTDELVRADAEAVSPDQPARVQVRHVVFAHYQPQQQPERDAHEWRELSSTELIPRALEQTFSTGTRDAATMRAIVDLARHARGWSFSHSLPPLRAADVLLERLPL